MSSSPVCPDFELGQLTVSVQPDKGGDINVVKESQKKRGASVELVDEVLVLFNEHKQGEHRGLPLFQKAELRLTVRQPTTSKRVCAEK